MLHPAKLSDVVNISGVNYTMEICKEPCRYNGGVSSCGCDLTPTGKECMSVDCASVEGNSVIFKKVAE